MTRSIVVLLLLVAGACASTGSGDRTDRDVIVREEIESNNAANAYDLVQRIRPQWLRVRGTQNLPARLDPSGSGVGAGEALGQDLVVYYDNARMGGRAELRGIGLSTVQYIRRFDAAAANYRWGTGHTHGAILVSTEPLP